MIELMISAGIIAILLLASAGAMGESLDSTKQSRNLTQGALFLESVEEDLTAVSASDLLSMNGQRIFSTEPQDDALYRIEITTFTASIDIVQIRLSLVDHGTGRRVAAVDSLRAL